MTHTAPGGGGEERCGGRTVVVGVKLGSQSKELLTWALVKIAQSGDRVVALHVLDNKEVVDRNGKSSLLSLVKAFDSILEVYEGFCNLKQVDLKLKICRGSSVPKILVREAKSYYATQLIVGTAQTHHRMSSSASVAKYCAKKLSKDCSVLAVNSGKVVFHRQSSSSSHISAKDIEQNRRHGLLSALQRSLSSNGRVLSIGQVKPADHSCSVCLPDSVTQIDDKDKLAIVGVPACSSVSRLLKDLPELNPGWPLLGRGVVPNRPEVPCKVSVVQWAMRLPTGYSYCLPIESTTRKDSDSSCDNMEPSQTNDERTAIVPLSPNCRALPEELEGLHEKYSATCRLFKFEELKSATSNFMPANMIGKGGSSCVYRGYLSDGKIIAVKILKPSEDALKEFLLEIEIITDLHHKNIISIFGFCFEDNHLVLVHDFAPRGSLEDNLHRRGAFGWNQRHKVAIGVAEALDYLHSREHQPVIHRDVKSSNILLSDDFEPQLSDFGLAKWASSSSTHITCSDVAGTFGYLAPEYFMYGKVNEKIDVYAFGVVLLELISGRKAITDDCLKGQESIVMWAKPILSSDKFVGLLDPDLGGSYDDGEVESMALAASLCIRRSPRARPRMKLILKLLRGDAEAVKWAREQVSEEGVDEEAFPARDLRSHLNLALVGVAEDSTSVSSVEQSVCLEEYLRGRCSWSSSFD